MSAVPIGHAARPGGCLRGGSATSGRPQEVLRSRTEARESDHLANTRQAALEQVRRRYQEADFSKRPPYLMHTAAYTYLNQECTKQQTIKVFRSEEHTSELQSLMRIS